MTEPSQSKPTMTLRGRRLAFSFFRVAVVLIAMLAWFQRSLIYHPTKSSRLAAKDCELSQACLDLTVRTFDDLTLHGWLSLSGVSRGENSLDAKTALKQGNRPLVIIFPGNAGNRSRRQFLMQLVGMMGADSVIFDHRGYGDNDGSPTEAKLARDARTVWDHVTKDLGVPANRVVIYGESLGGGISSRLAGDLGAEGIEPGGVVLQSTFNSLVDTGWYHFPYLPVSLILIDRFESEKHIVTTRCPILQIHGKQDDIVPLILGQKLFDVAPRKSAGGIEKRQVLLPTANHNDIYFSDGTIAETALRQFLRGVSQRAGLK